MRTLAGFVVAAAVAAIATAPAHAVTPTAIDTKTANTVASAFASDCGACMSDVTECAQLTERRADCVVAEEGSCSFVVALRVDVRGYLYYDVYNCRSGEPPTADAQVREHPPGQFFEPLTPAAFEFASDVYPKHLPYPAFPVRHYHGTTSQKQTFDLWVTPSRLILTGSGFSFNASCWQGADFVPVGREHVKRSGRISASAREAGPTPAFRVDGRIKGRKVTGTLRLRKVKCQRKPIQFSGSRVGGRGR